MMSQEPRASLFADLNLKFQSKEVKPVTPAESEPINTDGPGIVLSFGSNGYGRLGLGMNESEYRDGARAVAIPRLIGTTLVAKEIACGAGHVICCVGGVCHAWGKCHLGQLGLGSEDMDCFAPTALPRDLFDGADIVRVGAGESHSLTIDARGCIWAFGCGFFGALGTGSEAHNTSPARVVLPQRAVDIAGGKAHTLAVGEDGSLWAWGRGQNGQLGLGGRWMSNSLCPRRVSVADDQSTSGVARVFAGHSGNTSAALTSDGVLLLWGDNHHGLCSTGGTSVVHSPTKAPWPSLASSYVLDAAIGDAHAIVLCERLPAISILEAENEEVCAIKYQLEFKRSRDKSDSRSAGPVSVYSWGAPGPWLGRNPEFDGPQPLELASNFVDVCSVACGARHTALVTCQGYLLTCGNEYSGKLGRRVCGVDKPDWVPSPVVEFGAEALREPGISAAKARKYLAKAAVAGANHMHVLALDEAR